jgi:hypothetical protein
MTRKSRSPTTRAWPANALGNAHGVRIKLVEAVACYGFSRDAPA